MRQYENIYLKQERLFRFLTREQSTGYAFACTPLPEVIPEFNRQWIRKAQDHGKILEVFFLPSPAEKSLSEVFQSFFQEVMFGLDGIIIPNLGLSVEKGGKDFLLRLNYGREYLQQLGFPILFWVDEKSLIQITQQAPDLYSQRAINTVFLDEKPTAKPKTEFWKNVQALPPGKQLQPLTPKIDLLKKQLADAKKIGLSRRQLADELALPLAGLYLEQNLPLEAERLLLAYQQHVTPDFNFWRVKGNIAYRKGSYQEARHALEQAKEIARFGPEERVVIRESFWLLIAEERFEEARKLAEEWRHRIDDEGEFWGGEQVSAWEALGIASVFSQHYQDGFTWLKKALELRRKKYPKDQADLASALANLSAAYGKVEQWEEALNYQTEAVKIFESELPADSLNLAKGYTVLATILWAMGSLPQAQNYISRAVSIFQQRNVPADHPDFQRSLDRRQAIQQAISQSKA